MHRIKFAKVRENAVIPTKREEDSDYDLYACFDEEEIVLAPFSAGYVPTGLVSAFDSSLGVKLEERGSNSKWCGIIQAGVIDSGYRGEWIIAVYNGNPVPLHISKAVTEVTRTEEGVFTPYSKAICQFHVREIPQVEIETASYEEILAVPSVRGTGKLGSSGK